MTGYVYLIGAGPGDPDLITVKGLRALQAADVIIYDRLSPPELLNEAKPGTELINAGKEPTRHRLSQDKINTLIVNRALRNNVVVRLKGGDPLVFGRGSEEALVCREHHIPFEIVPGISSSYAVPAYAGIPLTHRHLSSSFTVMTGHEDPTKPETSHDYDALAQINGTLVILMGVRKFQKIAQKLIDHGKDPATPAAIIEWGATHDQRTLVGTLADLPQTAVDANIEPPATIVIGEVVKLRAAGTAWFEALIEQAAYQKQVI